MPKSLPDAAVSTWGSRITHFGRANAGTALSEYALLLALFVGGGILACYTLGTVTGSTFGELAFVDSSPGNPDALATPAQSAGSQAAMPEPPSRAVASRLRRYAGWYVALALGGIVFLLVHFRRSGTSGPPAQEEAVDELPVAQSRQLFEKRQQIFGILSRDASLLHENTVEVRHLMSRGLTTVLPSMASEEVNRMMEREHFRHLLVCSEDNRLLGVLSDRDLNSRSGARAAALMTPDPIVVSPDTPIGQAITKMLSAHISCLPVTEDGVLVGVLTSTDLAMSLHSVLQVLARIAAELRLDVETVEREELQPVG